VIIVGQIGNILKVNSIRQHLEFKNDSVINVRLKKQEYMDKYHAMTWYYWGDEFTPEMIEDNVAFVYMIVNQVTEKKYIGKKRFQFTRSKKVKDRKKRVRQVKTSDWEDYYGSSPEVAKDIVKYGKDKFTRLILKLCKSKGEASYYELKEQIDRGVLFQPAEYYNSYIGARIHRNHLTKKER